MMTGSLPWQETVGAAGAPRAAPAARAPAAFAGAPSLQPSASHARCRRASASADASADRLGRPESGREVSRLLPVTLRASSAEPLAAIRAREAAQLRAAARAPALNTAVSLAAPVLVTLATFAAHTAWLRRELTPAQALVTVAIFNVARFALGAVPLATKNISEALVACRRIHDLLAAPELERRKRVKRA